MTAAFVFPDHAKKGSVFRYAQDRTRGGAFDRSIIELGALGESIHKRVSKILEDLAHSFVTQSP